MKHLQINRHSEYVKTIQNSITFKNKTGYCLELLTSETKRLLGITERKITKDKNGKNRSELEITEVELQLFILMLSTININMTQEICVLLNQISHLVSY